jgi:hypothetical protein
VDITVLFIVTERRKALSQPYRKADLARLLREVVGVSELLSQSQAPVAAAPIEGPGDDAATQ